MTRDYQLGILLAKKHHYLDAQDRFLAVLDNDPKKLPDIQSFLFKRLTMYFNNLPLRILIAELYTACGHFVDAVDELEEAFELDPQFTQTYFMLSKIYSRNGHHPKIESILEQAFDMNIFDNAILDLLPKIYLENRAVNKSIRLFEKLVELRPDIFHYQKTLADLYVQNGHFEKGATLFVAIATRASELAPEMMERVSRLCALRPDSGIIRKAAIRLSIKACRPSASIPHIQTLIRLDASYLPDAILLYKEMLGLFPDMPDLLIGASDAFIANRDYSEAVDKLHDLFDKYSDYSAAIKERLDRILVEFPDQVMALQLLADLYLTQSAAPEALGLCQRLIELGDPDGAALDARLQKISGISPNLKTACLVQSALIKGEVKSAVHHAFAQLREDPLNWDTFELLEGLQRKLVDINLSRPQPDSGPQAIFRIGLMNMRLGHWMDAIAELQKVPNADKLYPRTQFLIGRCFLERGDYTAAAQHLGSILEPLANHARFFAAGAQIASGRIREAQGTMDFLLGSDIQFPHAQHVQTWCKEYMLAPYYCRTVSGCFRPGSFEFSLMLWPFRPASAGSETPTFSFSHNHTGVEHVLHRNFKEAEREFQFAVKMDSQFSEGYASLALTQMLNGNLPAAKESIAQAEAVWSSDVVNIAKGLIYSRAGHLDEALDAFKKAAKANPQNGLAKLNLGDCYFAQKNVKRALECWESAEQHGFLRHLTQRRTWYLNPEAPRFSDWLVSDA